MLTDLLFIVEVAGLELATLANLNEQHELTRLENTFASISDQLDHLINQINN